MSNPDASQTEDDSQQPGVEDHGREDHGRVKQNREDENREDQGPGWMPAILAGTVLMMIVGFVVCGFTTWVLFQKRGELAVRTLRGSFIPSIQQSRIDTDEKIAIIEQLEAFSAGIERGEYENWQAAAVMQRLQRLPVLYWGSLAAVEAHIKDHNEAAETAVRFAESLKQVSRLKRAVELGDATIFDFQDVLAPVHQPGDGPLGFELMQPLTDEAASEVALRAKLVADRSEVADELFSDIRIDAILGEQIRLGVQQGAY